MSRRLRHMCPRGFTVGAERACREHSAHREASPSTGVLNDPSSKRAAWWMATKLLKFSRVPHVSLIFDPLPPLWSVCFCHSVYDAPVGTAITVNAAWGAWGAQCPRAAGKSVTVRSQNDQVLSKLWQLLTTSYLLIGSNAKLFFFSSR